MTISPPIRIAAILGVLLAAVLAFFMLQHRSTSSSSAPAVPTLTKPHKATRTPAHVTAPKPHQTPVKTKPKIVLLPNLPASIAHALRYSKVVVVSLYTRGATGDTDAVAEAATGARAVHAGFLAVNLRNEGTALKVGKFAGTTASPPMVLIVRRPGRIVNQFPGFVDSDVVAQAAQNAGAHR